MKITDTDGTRSLDVDGWNTGAPESVFISSCGGFCMELNRQALIEVMSHELGLIPLWRVASVMSAA